MRRRFRFDESLQRLVEVSVPPDEALVAVVGDIQPFVSPVDGTVISSRSQLRDYMERRDLVHYDPTRKAEADRYATSRQDTALREMLWEGVDRALRTGRGPNG
jgi:hypothetical protein